MNELIMAIFMPLRKKIVRRFNNKIIQHNQADLSMDRENGPFKFSCTRKYIASLRQYYSL